MERCCSYISSCPEELSPVLYALLVQLLAEDLAGLKA